MEKCIYDKKNGLWYELQGDYYLPCLKLPKEETAHIGIFGQWHRRYLKTHCKALYSSLLTSELLYLQEFQSMEHFKQELIEYLDYYNNRRIKAKLKGLPPAIHRQQALLVA